MKKYILIAFLFVFTASMGQIIPKVDGWVTKPKAAPGTPVDGEVYYDSTTKKTYQWNGTIWIDWSSVITLDATLQDGSTNGVENNAVFDALALKANDIDVVKLAGNQSISGTKTFNGETRLNGVVKLDNELWLNDNGDTNYFAVQEDVNNGLWFKNFTSNQSSAPELEKSYTLNFSGDPVNPQDVADKEYVDAQVAGAGVTLESTLINGSTNGVENNAVFDGLALKASLTSNNIFTGSNTYENPIRLKGFGADNFSALNLYEQDNVTVATSIFHTDEVGGEAGMHIQNPSGNRFKMLDTGRFVFENTNGTPTSVGIDFKIGANSYPLNATSTDITYNGTSLLGGGTPADNSVTSVKILDGTIATADLADLSITNDKVALSAITNDKIANETITGAKIQDASIGLADLSATGIKDVTTVLHGDGVFRAVSGSTNNDALTEQALAGNYTLVAGDFTSGRKVIYNNTANDYQVTVPDVATVGQKLIFSQYGTGKIQVGMGSGVTGTSFQTVDNTSNLTMYKSAVGYRPVGAYDPYTPVPANLYTLSNAASPTNEANNATGFVNDITVSFSSSATAPQDGLYSVVMEHTGLDNTSVRGTTSFTSDGVSQYSIKVFVKEMIGTNWSWSINSGEGWTASQTVNITAVGEWIEYEIIATANATNCLIRFNGTSSSDTGNQLGIDNIRIVKL